MGKANEREREKGRSERAPELGTPLVFPPFRGPATLRQVKLKRSTLSANRDLKIYRYR